MAKKTKGGKRDPLWAEAKQRCRLNREDIRMAKEMGLNPRSLIKNIPSKSEPWKLPVKDWIREMYRKRQEKAARKKARRSALEQRAREGATNMPAAPSMNSFSSGRGLTAADIGKPPPGLTEPIPAAPFGSKEPWDENLIGVAEDTWPRKRDNRPSDQEIREQDQYMLRRQRNFRLAGNAVAAAFAQLPEVKKVVLFGSVAFPLKKEVPRFREFRRHGITVWHECKDVDLAVWLSDLDHLRNLQKARSHALNEVYQRQNVGVAHHQVEVFIMEPGTDNYLGRLCTFNQCPKDKLDCLVPGCGDVPFLKQHKGFVFSKDALAANRTITLFERQGITPLKEDNDVALP